MTSLSQQINNLAVRMAQEINAVRSEIGNHSDLLTIEKSTIVGAINELYNSGGGGGGAPIDDTGIFLNKVWSSSHTSSTIDGRISTALSSLPVAATIDDDMITSSSVWSSFKTNSQINTTLAAGLAGFLNDAAMSTDTTWSSSKISQVIAAIPPSSSIDDSVTSTATTWSSDKITSAIAAVNKASIGLGNVDNTSDMNKPVSTAQNAAIAASVAGITKATVGLGNVDNTSDVNKPVSTAQNAAIVTAVANVTKTSLGLGNVDNTSDVNKPVSTAQASADAATLASSKAYADSLVIGLWQDRGNYDASTNVFPSTGGSGPSGAVNQADIWTINVAGTLGGQPVAPNQTVRAMIDNPGQTAANWSISNSAMANIDDFITDGVTGRAPSQNAVFDALVLKQDKLSVGTAAQVRLGNNALATADKSLVGLGNVENKSGATIRSEGTTAEITTILGFTPGHQVFVLDEGSAIGGSTEASAINFVGAGVTATQTGGNVTVTIPGSSGGAVIDDASTAVDKVWSSSKTNTAINAGVSSVSKTSIGLSNVENMSAATIRSQLTATEVNNALTFTAGPAITVKDEGANLTTLLTSMNFVGPGVTSTNTGGAVTVTVPGGGATIDDAGAPSSGTVWSGLKTSTAALSTVLTGWVVAVTNAAVVATDTITVAIGKIQKQLNDIVAAAVTLTGAQTLTQKTLTDPQIAAYKEVGVIKTAGTVLSISVTDSKVEFSSTGNTTISFVSAPAAGRSGTILIKNGGGAYTHTFQLTGGGALRWAGGAAPADAPAANKWYCYAWYCDEAATTYILNDAGRNI